MQLFTSDRSEADTQWYGESTQAHADEEVVINTSQAMIFATYQDLYTCGGNSMDGKERAKNSNKQFVLYR